MAGSSSGANQPMPVPTVWITSDGKPTPAFFEFLRALWLRTGGSSSPSSGGDTGIALLMKQIAALQLEVDTVGSLAELGLLGDDDGTEEVVVVDTVTLGDVFGLLDASDPPPGPEAGGLLGLLLDDSGGDSSAGLWLVGLVTALGSGLKLTGSTLKATGMLPLVNGTLPGPVLMADGLGQCIGVPL